ncbi:MAG: UDP-N-acetylmuramoyl-L-alanyl-D-glutamate--2,6-diaminopimelate ligase [candidate division Zixibacteria bacterium]|nr:UDP-N-acetylmuramoyl-L-alanyl-D-glutamate--2,6-diaminopimelate ligase [candidate division Zixibacteria bacterium]
MPVDVAMNTQTHATTLGALFDAVPAGCDNVPVSGIAYDSRRVQPGDVFFAIPGEVADGRRFVPAAVNAGAVAVVAEQEVDADVPVIMVDSTRRAMAEASLRFWGHPDRAVTLIGPTGTNGKSTVAAGLKHVLTAAGMATGLIGTLTYEWGQQSIEASRTTPESRDLIEMLARMRQDDIAAAAIEVSSHAIALDRVYGLTFAGAIFTNMTRDHLDYHRTMEEYRRVKLQHFEKLESAAFAAINIDDPHAEHFLEAASHARIIRYSTRDTDADVYVNVTDESLDGSRGTIHIDGNDYEFRSPLWGAFNHSNIAAITAGAHGMGCAPNAIAEGLGSFAGIIGRCQHVDSTAPFSVYVDFAHTPDALNAVLSAVRPLVAGRLLVLFGCGGDRDRGKRPEMAQAVERWADVIYLTSDNPRSEDPLRIIDDVQQGFSAGTHVRCEPDRIRAIEQSIADAEPGDVVFLCGKGHEATQNIAGVLHPMNDWETAARILAARGHAPQTSSGGGNTPG